MNDYIRHMKHLAWISVCIIFIFSCAGNYHVTNSEYKLVAVSSFSSEKAYDSIVAPYKQNLDETLNEVIGFSDIDMPKEKGLPETVLGNFVSDLLREVGKEKTGVVPDAVFLNIGGLRSSLPKGAITTRNIFELMPFENELVLLHVDSNVIHEMIKHLISVGSQPFSGFKIYHTRSGKITFQEGEIFKSKATYTILTSDYLANGGDQMSFFLKATQKHPLQIKMRDAIIDYIKKKKNIHSELDKRIVIEP